ncbi:hypothetical protein BDV06DRAFT_220195 [Aspergillus oleicola]
MEPETKSLGLPPSYEDTIQEGFKNASQNDLPPTKLLLEDGSIREQSTSTLFYKLSRSVTTLPKTPPKNSSVTFERVESSIPEKAESSETPQQNHCHKHLFYLAHPADAQYRTDTPAYYITSVDASTTLGNLHFETSKPLFQKTEFTARLSSKRTSAHNPLFDEAEKTSTLFTARSAKWLSGRSNYTWTDGHGRQMAIEDGPTKNSQHRLDIFVPMSQEMRDALVSLWVLRLWFERAESREAKKEALERMTPAVPYQDMKLMKKTGALGALGAVGC